MWEKRELRRREKDSQLEEFFNTFEKMTQFCGVLDDKKRPLLKRSFCSKNKKQKKLGG